MEILDLTKQAPRSVNAKLGGYVILGRTIDKGRAALEGKNGEYNFDCPLDRVLFEWKGITAAQLEPLLKQGASDEKIAEWVHTNGNPKSAEEIEEFNTRTSQWSLYNDENPEKREWYIEACKELGLDPATTPLFTFLDADDAASFAS